MIDLANSYQEAGRRDEALEHRDRARRPARRRVVARVEAFAAPRHGKPQAGLRPALLPARRNQLSDACRVQRATVSAVNNRWRGNRTGSISSADPSWSRSLPFRGGSATKLRAPSLRSFLSQGWETSTPAGPLRSVRGLSQPGELEKAHGKEAACEKNTRGPGAG